MTREEALYVLRNTAWLGTADDLAKVEKALEVLAQEEEIVCCGDCRYYPLDIPGGACRMFEEYGIVFKPSPFFFCERGER